MRALRPPAPLAVFVLILVWVTAAPRAVDSPARHPYVGVTLIERVLTTPRPAHLHLARIDLRAPGIRVAVTAPSGGREVVRETTLDFLARTGAQLAVNGHFFLPFPADDADAFVIGLAAAEGRVYSAFEHPEQDFAILPDAPALVFDRRHRARIAARRPGADPTRVAGRGTVWNAVAGSAQIITNGRVTVPVYRDDAHPRGALTPGPDGRYSNARSWYDLVTSRTIAGLSRDHRILTLVASEGRHGADGLTVAELAELLRRDDRVWNAVNLDGGGSTSLAWMDPATGTAALLNRSTDGPAGRRVASNLAIYATRPRP
ncbi:MAG TPA: phosphodiester glycosidase family protein [Vicinamibacterales bacterium]|nr:phosphodiester glycosidase family protein [Vicinamibacterales bacterium]